VITGRRQSQGADRATLQPLEVDETGLLKLNPLFEWTFPIVEWYISEYDVPRNKLLAQGYRSVGDWHSTVKVGEGQSERAGRWAGKEKTECGLHRNYFTMQEQVEKAVSGFPFLRGVVLVLTGCRRPSHRHCCPRHKWRFVFDCWGRCTCIISSSGPAP
jgi:hypothetical protein